MQHRFKGLEKFGLESLKDINIYEDNEEKNTLANGNKGAGRVTMITEEDVLFDKSYKCPCCDSSFKTKAVRAGRTKLERMDNDLRPIYSYADAIKYESVVCPKCGYAGLIKNFNNLTYSQSKLIKEKISSKFKGINHDMAVYSYDDAIERAQLALLSSIVKGAKNSEKAYACLKVAWLFRGKRENLNKELSDYESKEKELLESELHYLKNAYEGFSDAYFNEDFPIAGMDESTLSVVQGETARKLGKREEALKYLAKVIVSKTASERLKDIARNIKDDCMKTES